MQVLDDEQHRGLAREPVEHREQRLEDPALVAGAAHALARGAEAGQQRGQLGGDVGRQVLEDRVAVAHERAERRDERRVGQLALAQLDAVAAEHARAARGGARLQLPHEPALADAGLPDDEGERRLAARGVGERGLELRQLERAADESG